MLLKLLNIAIAILLIQCQDASNFQAGGSANPDEMSAEEEGVVPPTNISGAYLTVQQRLSLGKAYLRVLLVAASVIRTIIKSILALSMLNTTFPYHKMPLALLT